MARKTQTQPSAPRATPQQPARLFQDPAPSIAPGPAQDFFALAGKLREAVAKGIKPWAAHETARDYAAIMHWAIRKQEYGFAAESVAALEGDRPLRILDLGCGVVPFGHFLAGRGHDVTAIDPLTHDLALLAQGRGKTLFGGAVRYAAAFAEALPFGDASFDAVACVSVLEHLVPGNDRLALMEIARILKPDGHLILTFDIAPPRSLGEGEAPLPAAMRHYETAYSPAQAEALFADIASAFELPQPLLPEAAHRLTWEEVRRFWRAAQERDGRDQPERPYLASGLVLRRSKAMIKPTLADYERWMLLGQTALSERMAFFRHSAEARGQALQSHAEHLSALNAQVAAELRLLRAQRQALADQRTDLKRAQEDAQVRHQAFSELAGRLESAWNEQIALLAQERGLQAEALSKERHEQIEALGREREEWLGALNHERREQIEALGREREGQTEAFGHERRELAEALHKERREQIEALSQERRDQAEALGTERQIQVRLLAEERQAQIDAWAHERQELLAHWQGLTASHGAQLSEQRQDVATLQAALGQQIARLADLHELRAQDREKTQTQIEGLRQWVSESTTAQTMILSDMANRLAVVAARLEHFHVEAERRSLPGLVRRAKGRIRHLPRQVISIPFRLRSKFAVRLGFFYQYSPRPMGLYEVAKAALPDNPPKISIVTPSYNQGPYIGQTIASVLGQYYPNIEYGVQDGGSTDQTLEIIGAFADRLTFWESKKDKGQTNAINLGMARTTGEIMAWLNSDDLLLPGSLNYVADYFQRHPDVDVIYGHRVIINETGQEIGVWIMPRHDKKILHYADYVPQETLFWRRRAWDKIGARLDENFRFAMDWDFLLRLQDAGCVIHRVPRFLGAFRVHAAQKTTAEIGSVGEAEMNGLRERKLGRRPTIDEINRRIAPFLRRHVICHLGWRAGLWKY